MGAIAMHRAVTLFDTTVGKKAALAISGLVLFGFVLQHMIGNLQVFLGPEVFNAYAANLKSMPALVWSARTVLLLSLVVHVTMMVQLYQRSIRARGRAYKRTKHRHTSYASATMQFTGPMLFLYIVFHIAHFTAPGLSLGEAEFSSTDVYTNFVSSFSVPWVTLVYCTANLLLGLHLYHGAWSLLQTLGLDHPRYRRARNGIAQAIAITITAGNVLMPIAVLLGVIS
jgi:succinate dehydrogenase / fumarate reductase cytochrome b subunit